MIGLGSRFLREKNFKGIFKCLKTLGIKEIYEILNSFLEIKFFKELSEFYGPTEGEPCFF